HTGKLDVGSVCRQIIFLLLVVGVLSLRPGCLEQCRILRGATASTATSSTGKRYGCRCRGSCNLLLWSSRSEKHLEIQAGRLSAGGHIHFFCRRCESGECYFDRVMTGCRDLKLVLAIYTCCRNGLLAGLGICCSNLNTR